MATVEGLGVGVTVSKKMNNLLGPATDSDVLPGEKVAVTRRRVVSRKGRCVVRVRIILKVVHWGG